MAHKTDYMPTSESEIITFAAVLLGHVRVHGARFGIDITAGIEVGRILESLIPITFLEVEAAQTAYLAAHELVIHPETKTSITIEEKNRTLKDFVAKLRLFIKEYLLYNPLVTDADRLAMGLPLIDTVRTPSQAETTHPVGEAASTKEPATLEFRVHGEGGKRAKIIEGQSAVELGYVLSDIPVTDWNDLLHSELSTRGIFRKTFAAAERAKILYFAFRWVGPRGQKGPWSNIQNIPVP
jgi:hypothetical protein